LLRIVSAKKKRVRCYQIIFMIERIIQWNKKTAPGDLISPFMRGKGERPLRLTFHISSLTNATGETFDALRVLQELGHLSEITAFQTEPGDFPHILIDNIDPIKMHLPVHLIKNGETQLYTSIWHPGQWLQVANSLVGKKNIRNQDPEIVRRDLITARAHLSVGGDILITLSPTLLNHQTAAGICETNPRTPEETAQIVGLFLRSRGIYTYSAGRNYKRNFDRGLFYWVLARHRLPSMWRYFSACIKADQNLEGNIQGLGQSILTRAVRALEARDVIGTQFYVPQSNETRDQIMYHFDYLTLVLAGAIDAQTRIAHKAYKITGDERYASFRDKKFRKALVKNGAHELFQIVDDPHFDRFSTLLYELRNTIHGAAMQTIASQQDSEPEISFVMIPDPVAQKLLASADQLGGAETWGLSHCPPLGILLEPYAYAVALVREGLATIDRIASATDVNLLFPAGQQIPSLKDTAPNDEVFRWSKRISLLG
jgi:hypothetical protein